MTEAGSYVANFELNSYEINAVVDPEGMGVIVGGGVYHYGETVTLTVTPNEGYEFVNWTENGQEVSNEAAYSFVVNANRELVAHLRLITSIVENGEPVVNIYPNPVSEKLTVESQCSVKRCEVYSMTGALVLVMTDCANQFEIHVESLSSGTYVIRLVSDEAIQTKRFVKE